MSLIENLERMLAAGQDSAMLRFGLGKAYADHGDPLSAVTHLREAVRQDPGYSAAWKMLGRNLEAREDYDEAREVYAEGIRIAEEHGDLQAAKEMNVFLRRLRKGEEEEEE